MGNMDEERFGERENKALFKPQCGLQESYLISSSVKVG